jgi:hypothetical protein
MRCKISQDFMEGVAELRCTGINLERDKCSARHFSRSQREYQDGLREYEDITVKAAKLCRHKKKRAEF